MTYILLSPTIFEVTHLLPKLGVTDRRSLGVLDLHCGKIGKKRVVAAISGVGKVNTAYALTLLFEAYPETETVILSGCGGAYSGSGGAIGDVMIATEEIYADEGVLIEEEWLSMEDIGIPLLEKGDKHYFNNFVMKEEVLERVRSITDEIHHPEIIYGRFLTISTCSGSSKRGSRLYERFGAICENMEGAAAAHIAAIYDVDLIEVRGVSNLVEDRVFENWDIRAAVKNCSEVVLAILRGL
ncbi:futalosine hydrolase [Methanosarcinales archaeon]|nr:MAG: futalosine hydrolase [Methanosarcinales archaeon]